MNEDMNIANQSINFLTANKIYIALCYFCHANERTNERSIGLVKISLWCMHASVTDKHQRKTNMFKRISAIASLTTMYCNSTPPLKTC